MRTKNIEKIEKYIDTQIANIRFIHERIAIQSSPGYNPIREYTQHTEIQYSVLDLEIAWTKLNSAQNWLSKNKKS